MRVGGELPPSIMPPTVMHAFMVSGGGSGALQREFSTDATLGFHVIAKLCPELRQTQRHAFVLAAKRTVAKLTLFLQMLAQIELAKGQPVNEIYLPMSRSDIAEYVGASLAAISRAFRTLTTQGVLQVHDRQHVKILDQRAFEQPASERRRTTR
jgi:CRP/FNR family transcriptional regulator